MDDLTKSKEEILNLANDINKHIVLAEIHIGKIIEFVKLLKEEVDKVLERKE